MPRAVISLVVTFFEAQTRCLEKGRKAEEKTIENEKTNRKTQIHREATMSALWGLGRRIKNKMFCQTFENFFLILPKIAKIASILLKFDEHFSGFCQNAVLGRGG